MLSLPTQKSVRISFPLPSYFTQSNTPKTAHLPQNVWIFVSLGVLIKRIDTKPDMKISGFAVLMAGALKH